MIWLNKYLLEHLYREKISRGKRWKGDFAILSSVVRKSYWEIGACAECEVDEKNGDICKENNIYS